VRLAKAGKTTVRLDQLIPSLDQIGLMPAVKGLKSAGECLITEPSYWADTLVEEDLDHIG
jgi:hypothetical protein